MKWWEIILSLGVGIGLGFLGVPEWIWVVLMAGGLVYGLFSFTNFVADELEEKIRDLKDRIRDLENKVWNLENSEDKE